MAQDDVVGLILAFEKYASDGVASFPYGPVNDAKKAIELLQTTWKVPLANVFCVVSAEDTAELERLGVTLIRRSGQLPGFADVHTAIKQLRGRRDARLFVLASGHGIVQDRQQARLLLPDCTVDDKQSLSVQNLSRHLASAKYNYPRRQLFVFDMCGTEYDTLAQGSALPTLEFQYEQLGSCRQTILCAASVGTQAHIDPSTRLSSFWQEVVPELEATGPTAIDDGDDLFEAVKRRCERQRPHTRPLPYRIDLHAPSGASYTIDARHSGLSKRAIVGILAIVAVVVSLLGWILFGAIPNYRAREIDQLAEQVDLAKAADLPEVVARIENSWFKDAVLRKLRMTDERQRSVNALAAEFLLDPASNAAFPWRHTPEKADAVAYLLGSAGFETPILESQFLQALTADEMAAADRAFSLGIALYLAYARDSSQKVSLANLDAFHKHYREHPDAGVHAILRRLLRLWRHELHDVDLQLAAVRTEAQAAADLRELPTPTWFVTKSGLTMVAIAPGTLTTGHPNNWPAQFQFIQPGEVPVPYAYAISSEEVRNADFNVFMESNSARDAALQKVWDSRTNGQGKSERWITGPGRAATRVSWIIALRWCDWLTRGQESAEPTFLLGAAAPSVLASRAFRLPTEVEWEYACRAGGAGPRHCDDASGCLLAHAWLEANSLDAEERIAAPRDTGARLPNRWGLFDMYGNVSEWCLDNWTKDLTAAVPNWQMTSTEPLSKRVVRGCNASDVEMFAFSAYRSSAEDNATAMYIGFRFAKTLVDPLHP